MYTKENCINRKIWIIICQKLNLNDKKLYQPIDHLQVKSSLSTSLSPAELESLLN